VTSGVPTAGYKLQQKVCVVCEDTFMGKYDKKHCSKECKWFSKHIRQVYRLSMVEYKRLVELSGGACAICRIIGPLNIDHDHKTGEVRGLLCRTCNLALGALLDDQLLFFAAIDYLRNPPARLPITSNPLEVEEDLPQQLHLPFPEHVNTT